MPLPPQKFPDLTGKVEPKVETEIFMTVKRLYEYIDSSIRLGLDSLERKLSSSGENQLAINVLKTDEGLKPTLGSPTVDGHITIRDDAGNSIKVLITS